MSEINFFLRTFSFGFQELAVQQAEAQGSETVFSPCTASMGRKRGGAAGYSSRLVRILCLCKVTGEALWSKDWEKRVCVLRAGLWGWGG